MNIKREVYDRIIKNIRRQISDIDCALKQNKYKFRTLEFEQTVLKRQKTELVKLINTVEYNKRELNNTDNQKEEL